MIPTSTAGLLHRMPTMHLLIGNGKEVEVLDIILTNLDSQETPGGGPQNALQGLLDPNTFQSTESIQTQANDSTGLGPPFEPQGPPPTIPPGPPEP